MDIHRSRFVPYPLSPVTAIAFTRTSDAGFAGPLPPLRLAIGRADGRIEIWNPQRGAWVQETVLSGGDAIGIDDLAWTQDPDDVDPADDSNITPGRYRLFSIASSPAVTEWDLATARPKHRSTGNFSEVWTFAAQPRQRAGKDTPQEPSWQDIVAGCGDGTLVLLGTADGELQFRRVLARPAGKRARCMSVTWQNRERVVAGYADGLIRLYDARGGTCLVTLGLGLGVPGASRTALVWKVRCLPNGDIVSGDSNGEVRVWDGRMYAQLQRLIAHDTDCLDLVVGSDGKTILSGSMDGKLAVFRLANDGQGRRMWAKGAHRRVHHGEVKAMAAYDSKAMSVVVSGGGSDATPVVTPLREYGKENLRSLPNLPQDSPVTSAPRARLLVSWWDSEIYVWRIAKQSAVATNAESIKPRKLVARLSLNATAPIRSVAVSDDGKAVAAATDDGLRVFQLRRRTETDTLAIRKLDLPDDLARCNARLVAFSPDTKWLVTVTLENEVYVARVAEDDSNAKYLQVLKRAVELERQHRHIAKPTAFKGYDRTITRLAFSCDSHVLVAGDLSGFLDSWVLEGNADMTAAAIDIAKHESDAGSTSSADSDSSSSDSDSDDEDEDVVFFGQHWTKNPHGHLLPKLDSAPLVLTFRPPPSRQLGANRRRSSTNGNPGVHVTRHNPHARSHDLPSAGPYELWCMSARHRMLELDVMAGQMTAWSRRNPFEAALPAEFARIRERVVGAVWDHRRADAPATKKQGDASGGPRLWLYGSNFVFMLDVGADLVDSTTLEPYSGARKRRRRGGKDGAGAEGNDDDSDVAETNASRTRKQRRLESGAGNRVVGAGIVDGVVTTYSGATKEVMDIAENSEDDEEQMGGEEADDDDEDDTALVLTRLAAARGENRASEEDGGGSLVDGEKTPAPRKWWCSFKYRPILGMVPLEAESDDDASDEEVDVVASERVREVVLVERPLWDVQRDEKTRG